MQHSEKKTVAFTRRGFLQTTAAMSAAVVASLNTNYAHAAGSDKIRVGLVGCGSRGRGAAADSVNSSPNVQLVALGDLFQDQLTAAKAHFDTQPKAKYDIKTDQCFVGWDAYQKVLACDIDYVILATAPGFRPLMIDAAIKAGKHVFAEKPVAVCPTGVRMIMAAAEEAEKKGLAFVIGTQRRHQPSYLETIKRIHDGAIGKVVAGQVYWTQGGAWVKERKPEWSDVEWQIRNWMYFTWLAGDHIVEQHMHQHDVANWVIGDHPKQCIAVGGRQVRTDAAYGHIYDHFSVDYEYPNGARVQSVCRQTDGCYNRVGENFIGTKGSAIAETSLFDENGKRTWKFSSDEEVNPYEQEHADLIKSIRDGKPINEAKRAAESTLTAIMGRLAAYTGKMVRWTDALNSKLDLTPKKLEFGAHPVDPVAMPGKTPMI
ncbi:MAG TPA: Gfo/Idh/MocA family oxidoreductase [Tepidisphaeraceae bacterium]|nr:Gfo/Idh/MocA family oxidoreductase [Tepidisphaeraceae bacterium]